MASIIEYLPAPLTVIREFTALASAEDPELTSLWTALRNSLDDQFIDDATLTGIEMNERGMHIKPKPTSSLEERRAVVKVKITDRVPYTQRVLDRKLKTLCGEGGYTLTVNVSGYAVDVRVALTSKEVFDNVAQMLDDTVPLNMTLTVDLLYNQHQTLAQYTHARLALFTHAQLRADDLTGVTYGMLEGLNVSQLEGVN